MTILKNNHKSGINENNIKVATVTEEQIQSRAFPMLLPVMPITASVQVYQVSTTGIISYPDYPECSSQRHVFCKVTVTAGAKFKSISKALLKIEKHGGNESGNFGICEASENMMVLHAHHTNYLKTVPQNGKTYAVIDITEYVKEGKSKVFYLAIRSEDGNMLFLKNTGTLEVSFIEDDDLIPSGKLEKQVGSKGGYSINARNGKLQYNQQIFASKGGLMPFGLSLSYNASNCDSSNPNDIANGMKGWTFNYQQSLKQWLNDMLYVDASNVVHTFKHPTNNSTVWYDATGKNGMVLVETDSGYTMSDGRTMTLNFDTSKRLVSIVEKLSDSKNVTTTIEYASDGKISKVTDGLGDVYNFTWTSTLVQIKKGDLLLAEVTLASERVTQVKYVLSGDTVDFAYDSDGQLISVLDSASHQKAVFEYNTASAISAVKNYICQATDVATDSNHFEYKLLQTRIASCRNSDAKSNAYCTTAYLFAEDGELLTTAEVKGSALQPLRYRTKLDFEKSSGGIPDKVVGKALFNGSEAIETESSVTSSTFGVTNPGQFARTYVFSAAALISADDNVSNDGSQKLTVQICENGQPIASAEFDPSKREAESVCGTFTLSGGAHQLTAKLVLTNLRAKVTFGNVQVYSTNAGAQKQCINVDTNFSDVFEFDGSTTRPWNEQDYCSLQYDGETITNVIFNAKDHALTLISRLQNPTAYNVWYNDGKNMLYQVSNVNLISGSPSYPIGDIKICTMSTSMGKTVFEYIEPTSTYLYKARKVTTVTIDGNRQGVVAEKFVDEHFRTARIEDEQDVITTYNFDENGSVKKVRTFASGGNNLDMSEESQYNEHNLLASRTEQRYLTTYTHSFVYGVDYELTQDTQPNGLITEFAYSADKDKLASIFATVDEATSQNDISYDGDLVDTLSDTRTAVDFVYDERHNISQVDIAGATVLSKEIIYNANGCTQSETTYGNGQKIKKYYDKFDRLIKVSDVTTDETALVQYLYSDDEISQTGFDPDASFAASIASPLRVVVDHAAGTTTWYTYDEFGQVKKVQNQQITTTQTKDEFNRIKIVAHSFGGNFATNYTYASPTDDTLVAESTGGEIPIPISTTYVRDGLQRPTETIVMHGDFGYKQVLAYAPKQQEEWVDDGFGPIIRPDSVGTNAITPPSLGGHWEVTNIGTTPYVATFKEYSMSGTTATLIRTDSIEYDANGNITKYGGVTYQYDALNRLVRENNPGIDKTTTWCYDVSGNILSRTEYAYTTGSLGTPTNTFAYAYSTGWKDQLTSFNGQSISYDQAGNPTSYKGANLTWERGRLLKKYNNIAMQYDANGIRTRKIVPGLEYFTTTEYLYSGNNLLREIVSLTGPSQSSTIYKAYLYNSQGIVGFVDGGNTYTYRKNMFGDIIAIYNGSTKVAEYAYDAWGNCTIKLDTNGIGTANPFRYRGYYYDADIGLYYLMSRYYDPQVGRFINADTLDYLDPETIGGLNLYSYCSNNPVNYKERLVSSGGSITISSIFTSSFSESRISAIKQIAKTLSSSKSSGFNLFGYELRTSAGWDTSPDIATSFWGRIGFSSYITHTQGQSGMLYAFAGSTSDVMNWFGTTYYAGVGINLFDVLGVEAYLETVGIGAQVNIGRFSIGANINLIGGTSITFGWDTDLGNGMTKTDGFTVGINTGCLVAVIYWIYKFVTTGDPSPVPGLQPA